MKTTRGDGLGWIVVTDQSLLVQFASEEALKWLGGEQSGTAERSGIRLSLAIPELAEAILSANRADFPINCTIHPVELSKSPIELTVRRLGGTISGFCCYRAESEVVARGARGEGSRVHNEPTSPSRVSLLERVTTGVVHDLNNGVTGILGHVAYLRMILAEQGAHRESLHAIERGARQVGVLIANLGYIAQPRECLSLDPSDARVLIRQATGLMESVLPRGVVIEVDLPSNPLWIGGQDRRIAEYPLYFCLGLGGSGMKVRMLTLSLISPGIDPIVEGELGEPSTDMRLLVRVRCCGWDVRWPDWIASLVDSLTPRSQSAVNLSGGVSVSVTEMIPGAMGGGDGEFAVTFLFSGCVPDAALSLGGFSSVPEGSVREGHLLGRRPQLDVSVMGTVGRRERILVMDDDRAVRDVVALGLEQLGYSVTAVDSGEAAIAACQSGVPFDLVLLDMVLPNVTGDKVFSEIRSIHPCMKILVMSGFSRATQVEELLNSGRSVFLQKPFTLEELGSRVRECLDGD